MSTTAFWPEKCLQFSENLGLDKKHKKPLTKIDIFEPKFSFQV